MEVVTSRATTIANILSDATEISIGALHNCSAALVSMITSHSDLSASDGALDIVLQAISTIIAHGKSLPASISIQISNCMDKLVEAKGNELVPGESTSLVVDKIRFLSSPGFLSQAENIIYSTPQTSLEEFIGAPLVTLTFSQTGTTKSQQLVSSTATSMHMSRALKARKKTVGGSDDGGDGSVVQFSVSQAIINYLPGRSPDTTATKFTLYYESDPANSIVEVTIPNKIPVFYYDIKPKNGSVTCKNTGYPYSVSGNCSTAPDRNVTCPGNDTRLINFVCPGKKLVPLCLAWNGVDYVATDACIVLEYTPYNTTCACLGDTGYDEALGAPTDNNPQIGNIAASADIEVSEFVNTWTSAEDTTPDSPTKNKVLFN